MSLRPKNRPGLRNLVFIDGRIIGEQHAAGGSGYTLVLAGALKAFRFHIGEFRTIDRQQKFGFVDEIRPVAVTISKSNFPARFIASTRAHWSGTSMSYGMTSVPLSLAKDL